MGERENVYVIGIKRERECVCVCERERERKRRNDEMYLVKVLEHLKQIWKKQKIDPN